MESEAEEEVVVGVLESVGRLSDSDASVDLSGKLSCCDDLVGGPESLRYEFWTRDLDSVRNRRQKFLEWMDFGLDRVSSDRNEDVVYEKIGVDDRSLENIGVELREMKSEDEFSSSRSSWSDEALELAEDRACEDALLCEDNDLDDGRELVIGERQREGLVYNVREVGSNRLVNLEEFEGAFRSSKLVKRLSKKRADEKKSVTDGKKKKKKGWLEKLSGIGCMLDVQKQINSVHLNVKPADGSRIRDVKVHSHKKHSKELSSLLVGQDFLAHKGSILTMKFSHDGQYLASGGEDSVVRVWKVFETDRLKAVDMADSDFANVIVPPKVFSIREKPLYEYKGHFDHVLDLSWSKKGHLLSSSADKTVRLWQVGQNSCLGIFAHNNYVTSVQFNPENDDYFISGSIDGKVRIWEVQGCQVIDWTDTKEIITAVCYRPDGMGGIVGSLTGNCLFYSIKDNRMELDNQVSLQGKKKLQGKRITGFQFYPRDPSKVMVTSADSAVRILCGIDVICKLKGSRSSSQISASFTADGKQIVSINEDCNVHVWNYGSQDKSSTLAKTIESYESFSSQNASVSIPWPGVKKSTILPGTSPIGYSSRGVVGQHCCDNNRTRGCPCMSRSFYPDFLTKGNSTWPEEKLPNSSPMEYSSSTDRFDSKFLKSAQSLFSSPHMWGLVIVTAGWDGRIRTFINHGLPMHH
ncbi:hypothetical protein QQ045_016687 [Rhodiola kirilowii]